MSKSWVDDLVLESIDKLERDGSSDTLPFSVATFNILAEAYCSKRSHQHLPPTYADVSFKPSKRKKLLRETLTKLSSMFDLICLQELDELLLNDVVGHMSDLGYGWVWCKRGGSPVASNDVNKELISQINKSLKVRNSKPDGCGTFYLKSKWFVRSLDVVHFDDLADEHRKSTEATNGHPMDNKIQRKRGIHSLSGIVSSYKRTNSALIVELELLGNQSTKNVVLVNTHLYWHPGYEYVKLSQTHYLMLRVKEFIHNNRQRECIPLVCGDMNSKVNSAVYKYFVEGKMDARLVAPWSFHYDELEEQEELAKHMSELSIEADQDPVVIMENNDRQEVQRIDGNKTNHDRNSISPAAMSHVMSKTNYSSHKSNNNPSEVKYLLDVTLNKFTRWLRILGQDAALETADEERLRTIDANMLLFERSRQEKRVLVTTSKSLMSRKDCPPGTFLISPSTVPELEHSLVNLLLLNGVRLQPRKFLTRCMVCNGNIIEVLDANEKSEIFSECGAPNLSGEVENVYRCDGCRQGYWWSNEPQSTATRVKDAAIHLLRICTRGGVPVDGDLDFFEYDGSEEDRVIGTKMQTKMQKDGGVNEVINWLKNPNLSNPFVLRSAYGDHNLNYAGELIPFSNVTSGFVGLLDYILYEVKSLRQIGRLRVPKSFNDLNREGVHNGHLLPSNSWPSDHLCLGATFELKQDRSAVYPNVTAIPSAFIPDHLSPQVGCNCGCVPKVLSLFQMAELRKQSKLRQMKDN